jgi:hypothetical protein
MLLSKTLPTLVILAVLAAMSFAQGPAIKLPAEIKGEPGAFVAVRADTEGKTVRWVPLTPGLHVFPADLLRDSKATVVSSIRPGKYQLLAYTAKDDEPSDPAITTIVIGTPPDPGPNPPGPGPGPNPPEPDTLTKRIREALASDPGTASEKAKHAAVLAGFYAAMAKHVQTDQAATVGDLLSDYRAAIPAVLPDGVIPATRRLAGQEVANVCGDDVEKKIDGTLKTSLVSLFTKLSAALTIEAARGGR